MKLQPLPKIAIILENDIQGDEMEKFKSFIEKDSFLFCNKNGEISYIKLKELNKEQLEEFILRFTEYANMCILEMGSIPDSRKGFGRT